MPAQLDTIKSVITTTHLLVVKNVPMLYSTQAVFHPSVSTPNTYPCEMVLAFWADTFPVKATKATSK